MDLERLRNTAVSFAEQNVINFEDDQRRSAERAEAVARLKEAMQTREMAFKDLASVAVHYSVSRTGESMAIPVGRVSVQTASGETVDRNLHAVVHNNYDERLELGDIKDLGTVVPESILVNFSVEAEQGDVESGLFADTGSIGWVETDGIANMLYGQQLAREIYERNKAPVPRSQRERPSSECMTTLCLAETYDKDGAERQIVVIDSQLDTMRETLTMLHAGIGQSELAAVK